MINLIFFFFFLLLSFSSYQSLDLTLEVVNNWSNIPLIEKLNYYLLESDWKQYYQELESIGKGDLVTKEIFVNHLNEFQDQEIIEKFWNLCDNDQDDILDLREYALCRGEADRNGNYYEKNEYDYREQVIMQQFWEKIALSDYQPEIYQYDEDGIIID